MVRPKFTATNTMTTKPEDKPDFMQSVQSHLKPNFSVNTITCFFCVLCWVGNNALYNQTCFKGPLMVDNVYITQCPM